jgi:hypothetical protein
VTFRGRVLVSTDGELLNRGTLQIVAVVRKLITVVAEATISKGDWTIDADPGPAWGLRIDGRPVIATVAASDGATADLGDILLITDGVPWPAFHAPDGRVFGVPPAARTGSSKEPAPPAPPDGQPPAQPPADTTPRVGTRTSLTFGKLLGSSAQQLSSAVVAANRLQLAGANITIKGVPVATDEDLSIEFPNAELAAAGVGLSEVSFTLKPRGDIEQLPPVPAGPAIPDLRGYTRELALRKLAALGLASEVRSEVVTTRASNGRVVRQVPAPGQPVSAATIVQIHVGKIAE